MRKSIVVAVALVASSIFGPASAAENGLQAPPPSSFAQLAAVDRHKADWFAHAVADILAGGPAEPASQHKHSSGSATY